MFVSDDKKNTNCVCIATNSQHMDLLNTCTNSCLQNTITKHSKECLQARMLRNQLHKRCCAHRIERCDLRAHKLLLTDKTNVYARLKLLLTVCTPTPSHAILWQQVILLQQGKKHGARCTHLLNGKLRSVICVKVYKHIALRIVTTILGHLTGSDNADRTDLVMQHFVVNHFFQLMQGNRMQATALKLKS